MFLDVNYFGLHGAAMRVSSTDPQQLQNIPCAAVLIQNDADNVGNIYVGGIGAAAASADRDYKIYPGGEHVFPVNNTNLLTVIGDIDGDLVRYHIYRNYTQEPQVDYTVPVFVDIIPPTVASTFPINASTTVETNVEIFAIFSEDILPSSITATSVTISPSVANTVYQDSTDLKKIYLQPTSDLANSTTYNVVWTTELKDTAGNAMTANHGIIFTTAATPPPTDTTPPTVVSTSITDGATGVPITTSVIYAICSENIDNATVTAGAVTISPTVSKTVSRDGTDHKKIILTLTASLSYSTLYTVIWDSTLEDLAGNALSPITTVDFTTESAPVPPDTTPPTLDSVNPANGATNISATVPDIYGIFNEDLLDTSITASSVTISPSVAKTVILDPTNAKKVKLTPSVALANSTEYTVTYTTLIEDLAGNNLASAQARTFTTVAAPDTTPPTVSSKIPAASATGVEPSTDITIVFSEPILSAGVTATNFALVKVENSETITCSRSLSVDNITVTVIPTSSLEYSKQYRFTVKGGATGVKDTSSNAMAADNIWTFTTRATQETIIYNVANSGNSSYINMGEDYNWYAGTKITTTSHPLYNKIPHKVIVRGRRVQTPTTHARCYVMDSSFNLRYQIGEEVSIGALTSSSSSSTELTFQDATLTIANKLAINEHLVINYFEGNTNNYFRMLISTTNSQANAVFYYQDEDGTEFSDSSSDFAALVYENS